MAQINSVLLPLLGTREDDYTSFQYLPLRMEEDQVLFSIPNWVLKRDTLGKGDTVNLHLGLHLKGRKSSHAEISDSYTDSEQESEIYHAKITDTNEHAEFYVFITPDSSRIELNIQADVTEFELLKQCIKDCWMLKKGIAIYLKHLSAYFSRISQFSKVDYSILKETLLTEPLERINRNILYLETIYEEMNSEKHSSEIVMMTFDPDSFGTTLISELELELFRLSLDSDLAVSYIKTIKDLEERLFTNHNVVSALYARELESEPLEEYE
jgi:hypothetical protein